MISTKTILLNDGSKLIWQDRETLKYEEQNLIALVWMVYEPEFLVKGGCLRSAH